ncbi:hypothetical protein NL676_012074 [Syzygium grande]|nr:hypothetical protein NL676_012074 [Syzygium grande]
MTDGEGYLEMACPHLSSHGGQSSRRRHHQQGGSQTRTYHKVWAWLRHGTTFITPASYPVAMITSKNNNLQIMCFEVNAENNVKYLLAEKRNVINLMEREAKELAFDFLSRDVERVFEGQDEEFFAGPERWQEEKRGYANK